jgi:hypothetical protein
LVSVNVLITKLGCFLNVSGGKFIVFGGNKQGSVVELVIINNTNLLEIILNPTNIKQVKSLGSFIKQSLELRTRRHMIPFVLDCVYENVAILF